MVKRIILKAAVLVLRAIYAPIKLVVRPGNKITVISRQSNYPSADITLLSNYIADNYSNVRIQVLTKAFDGNVLHKLAVGFHMIRQMYHIAGSSVVVLDGYCITASVLRHREGITIVQMWHASAAIKKFGYQTIDEPSGHSSMVAEIFCMHRNYDYVLAPGEETASIFAKGFNVDMDIMQYYCLPRFDIFSNRDAKEDADLRSRLFTEYNLDENKRTFLYVPTFRRNGRVDLSMLEKVFRDMDCNVVVKLHPIDMAKHEEIEGITVADGKYDSYTWMRICENVITDYSAIGVEAVAAGCRVYFFAYDMEEYKKEVGLNIDPMRDFPWCSADTPETMAEIISKEYDSRGLELIKEKYISAPTEKSTARLCRFLVSLM